MDTVKWYKSKRKVDDLLTMVLIDDIKKYYANESTTDQTKLYQALGNYYIKTKKNNLYGKKSRRR